MEADNPAPFLVDPHPRSLDFDRCGGCRRAPPPLGARIVEPIFERFSLSSAQGQFTAPWRVGDYLTYPVKGIGYELQNILAGVDRRSNARRLLGEFK
jgi:hypothetical protein